MKDLKSRMKSWAGVRRIVSYWKQRANFRILADQYGQYRSIKTGLPVSRSGEAIPWYTYPAIAFLEVFDYSGKRVFEYGSGNSTLWWRRRGAFIVAVDHDRDWYNRMRCHEAPGLELRLHEEKDAYIRSVREQGGVWDVIIVDGRHRKECAAEALDHLTADGMIILDNSDWHPQCAAILRSADLIQIDFAGFGPVNNYTWVTSVFLRRSWRANHRGQDYRVACPGGLDKSRDA